MNELDEWEPFDPQSLAPPQSWDYVKMKRIINILVDEVKLHEKIILDQNTRIIKLEKQISICLRFPH